MTARFSGAIEKLFIENQDTVNIGQPVAVLRNTAVEKDVHFLKSILDSINYKIQEFEFPLALTSKLRLGEIEPAYIIFEKSYIEYDLLKDLRPYDNELSGNQSSLQEIKSQLNSQISQKNVLESEIILIQSEFDRHKILFEKGVISCFSPYKTRVFF